MFNWGQKSILNKWASQETNIIYLIQFSITCWTMLERFLKKVEIFAFFNHIPASLNKLIISSHVTIIKNLHKVSKSMYKYLSSLKIWLKSVKNWPCESNLKLGYTCHLVSNILKLVFHQMSLGDLIKNRGSHAPNRVSCSYFHFFFF